MSNRNITSIPCRTGQTNVFRQALGQLAKEMGVNTGDLVRAAIDEKYGDALIPLLSFFEARSNQNNHSVTIITQNGGKHERTA